MELNDTNRLAFAFGYLNHAVVEALVDCDDLDALKASRLVAVEIADGKLTSTEAVDRRWRELREEARAGK